MQNTSHAVMAQRVEARDSLDNFPTPPWATRSLLEYVIEDNVSDMTCLEPACGAGHMARPLAEYFRSVDSSDIADYGFGLVKDFFDYNADERWDWIITNPPFRLAEKFIEKSIAQALVGAAFLVRTTFIESIGRYRRLFEQNPPQVFAQFVERVPMIKGRLDPLASTATGYCWLVWRKGPALVPQLVWIPPCRRSLERPYDYSIKQLSLL